MWSLPIDRALNVVHTLIYSGVTDEQDRYRLDTALQAPMPGELAREGRSARDDFWAGAEDDGKAFLAAMGQQNQILSGKAPRR